MTELLNGSGAGADYFDGETPKLRRVEIHLNTGERALEIRTPDLPMKRWAFADIRTVPDQADKTWLALAHHDDPVARLYVLGPQIIAELRANCPDLRQKPPVKGRGRLFGWAAAAVASVALIVFVLVPVMANQLAEILPPEGEQALGDTTFEQIRSAFSETGFDPIAVCDELDGRRSLEIMQARLTVGVDLPYPIKVDVLDYDLVNAFALPGGRVVFFRGLIDEAEHPDEVAAVFAHEIGHVVNRDPARIALRTAGSIGVLGLLLGDFAGGTVVLFLTERLIQASYTQEAEALADAFAHETLAAAGIPPSSLGSMFRRLLEEYGDSEGIVAHFASHPALGDRIANAEAADALLTGAFRPSLNDHDWRALQNICG